MNGASEEHASEGDVDHGLGAVDALLIVAPEPTPSGRPPEGAFDDLAARQDFEALGGIGSFDDLDGEVEEGGLVHEFGAVIGAVSEQMLEPGPALAHALEDHLGAGAAGDVGGGEIDHQKATVGIDSDMTLSADNLLAGVITSFFSFRRLDRLAVDDAARRARLAPDPLTVEHQRHVMKSSEHVPAFTALYRRSSKNRRHFPIQQIRQPQ